MSTRGGRSARPLSSAATEPPASSSSGSLSMLAAGAGGRVGVGGWVMAGPAGSKMELPREAANRLDTNAGAEGEGGRGAGVRPGCGAASPRNARTS